MMIGLREVVGTRHEVEIQNMLKKMGSFNGELKAWYDDDETAWCGLFIGYCLGMSGRYVVKNWMRALAWGGPEMTKLNRPAYGCIMVMPRTGGGHVTFCVGVAKNGNLLGLGGNQSNSVSIAEFSPTRPGLAFYWPSIPPTVGKKSPIKSVPSESRYKLPIDGKLYGVSKKED